MQLNTWSILLTAFASQCIFLIVSLLVKPSENKKASILLVSLLAVILLSIISNMYSSTYFYRQFPRFAGFGRGMVLLIGPLLYFYSISVLSARFRFNTKHILHFLPYFFALVIIRIQEGGLSDYIHIAAVDSLMEGKVKMTFSATCWFIIYFLHLSAYVILIRSEMRIASGNPGNNYLVPVSQRLHWLKTININLWIIAIVFICIILYVVITGLYSISGNYLYTMALAALIYQFAYKALWDNAVMIPDFTIKYKSANPDDNFKEEVLSKLVGLFEHDKIFENPRLKIASVAARLNLHPNFISQVINEKMKRNFNDLLNYYRIKAFKERISQPGHRNYSIIGIAYDVGYNSKSAFNTAFKKQTGLTPSEYVKTMERTDERL